MAMADLVMPRLPDQRYTPFFQPATTHQRPVSYYQPPLPAPPQQQYQSQQPYQQQQQQQQQYRRPRYSPNQQPDNISPLSTSGNASPTSPRTPYRRHHQHQNSRQVRPMFMPAVLRPNEYPSSPRQKRQPQQPPSPKSEDGHAAQLRPSSSFMALGGLVGLARLSRRSVGGGEGAAEIVNWDWDLELFPEVNGLPTRKHWKADTESTICDDPTCKRYFNYFTRRHHCRRCGNIFCDAHSQRAVPLDESANYNPRGQPSRACDHCYGEFKVWRSRTNSQASSASLSSSGSPPSRGGGGRLSRSTGALGGGSSTAPASPVAAGGSPGAIMVNGSPTAPAKSQAEVALSVPSDWNWSTF